MRKLGRVPANVYGLELPPFHVAVSARRVTEVLMLGTGQNTILTLSMSGADEKRDVMIRELQRDPVSNGLVHVDFLRVDVTKAMEVSVPLRLLGTPEGVKTDGGVLDFVHREVSVSCLPANIPEHLDLDVSGLHLNQHISVADLAPPEGVEILDDSDTIVAVVAVSRAEVSAADEEAEAAEAAEAAETAEAAEGEQPAEEQEQEKTKERS
jgi:large subunit ribosomal protein L25